MRFQQLCCWVLLWFAACCSAKLTDEEKRVLKEAADEADKHIRTIEHSDLATFIGKGYYLITYGATWCRLTQRFTPHWLEVQDEFDHRGWNKVPNFGIGKVQCAVDEAFCVNTMGTHDGYPDIRLYWNGQLLEEYNHGWDKDSIIRFLEHVYEFVKQEHIEAAVPEHVEIMKKVEKEKPAAPAPSREPIHEQIDVIKHLDDNMLDHDRVDEEYYRKELGHQIQDYNDEVKYARITGISVFVCACAMVALFAHSRRSKLSSRYQQVTDRS